jgi:hypothetical protein
MIGGQLALSTAIDSTLQAGFTASYYHYRLGSVADADIGDFRGNALSQGRYISDFHLIEALGTIGWKGPSRRWPVTLTADYVKNAGARVSGDSGYNLDLAIGANALPGDWRLAYNYSEVGVDAVLAAFSHDNIDISTNYRLHGLVVSYVPARHLLLDAAWYRFRPLDPHFVSALSDLEWANRVRLDLTAEF